MTPTGSDPASRARVAALADADGKLALLLESERWGPERRRDWRREQLRRLLDVARDMPFWAGRLPEGEDIAGAAPLGREELRSGYESMASGAGGPGVTEFSSGSSGRPVRVLLGAEQIGYGAAARLRQLAWFEQPLSGASQANLLGRPGSDDSALNRLGSSPASFAINPWALDARTLVATHREIVAAGGVRLIGANTSMFVILAELYLEAGLDARELGCELAIVGSELTDDAQRETIERVFGCRTAEMYGAREAPMLGTECPAGSLHVNEDAYLVEILTDDGRPAGPGELGSVTVTHLHNVEMPLIRYQLGDAASFREAPCACGRTLAPLDLTLGHLEEMVLKRDGTMVHPAFIRNLYEQVLGAGLRAFHTDQPRRGEFVTYLDSEPLPEGAAEACRSRLEEVLGEPADLRLVIDPERARSRLPNGKLRTFTRSC